MPPAAHEPVAPAMREQAPVNRRDGVWRHADLTDEKLCALMASGAITLGGNERLRIFGLLSCRSGMRMKQNNRVFFADADCALVAGYRPCGHCMRDAYAAWKTATSGHVG